MQIVSKRQFARHGKSSLQGKISNIVNLSSVDLAQRVEKNLNPVPDEPAYALPLQTV